MQKKSETIGGQLWSWVDGRFTEAKGREGFKEEFPRSSIKSFLHVKEDKVCVLLLFFDV